jgi:hypothetical protein
MTTPRKTRKPWKPRGRPRPPFTGRDFVSYGEASDYVKKLGIRTAKDYQAWAAGKIAKLPPKPENIPSCPHQEYAGHGWKG